MRILTPTPMSTRPPATSRRLPSRAPNLRPANNPRALSTAVVMPNGQQRCDERSVQHGQRDADRERVNARGKRQQQHDSEPEEVALATILGAVPAASLPKHLSSDRAEQQERDPVVSCFDQGLRVPPNFQ